jgi:hypothetical protein
MMMTAGMYKRWNPFRDNSGLRKREANDGGAEEADTGAEATSGQATPEPPTTTSTSDQATSDQAASKTSETFKLSTFKSLSNPTSAALSFSGSSLPASEIPVNPHPFPWQDPTDRMNFPLSCPRKSSQEQAWLDEHEVHSK